MRKKLIVAPAWRRLEREDDDPLTYAEWLSICAYHPDQNHGWSEHERHGREHERFRKRYEETFDMGGES